MDETKFSEFKNYNVYTMNRNKYDNEKSYDTYIISIR